MKFLKTIFKKLEAKKLQHIYCITHLIQDFYLEKNKDPDIEKMYSKARAEIIALGITQIKLKFKSWDCSNVFTIVLCRPGLIIGRHGDNIDALQKYLSLHIKFIKNFKLAIEEDKVMGWLLPYQPEQYDQY